MSTLLLNVFTGAVARRSDISTTHQMPGNWPQYDTYSLDENMVDEINFQPGEDFEQTERRFPFPSQSNSPEEHFFDCATSRHSSPPSRNEESSMPSYLLLESGGPEIGEADWRLQVPPRELLDCQPGSSREIKDLLKRSIERVQARGMAADERECEAVGLEQPLTAPTLDQTVYSPTIQSSSPNVEDIREVSPSSFDSGYASATKPKATRGFGLGMFFRKHPKHESENRQAHRIFGLGNPTTSPSTESETLTVECVSCLDDFTAPEMIKLVCHSYCKECFRRLISTALESESHWPAKCCLNKIPSASILPHLETKMKRTYRKRKEEWSIPIGERLYCSQASCGTFIPPRNVTTQTNIARCPSCSSILCVSCRGPSHGMADCPQDPNIQMTNDLADLEGWKRCYQCRAYVEHNKGCRHITCRCKAQFCYICTKKWKTCACTDADLTTIQHRAMNIRQETAQRTARELAEAEEIRVAIQQVEEFERAETTRLALEAETERRQQEEARQRRQEQQLISISRLYSRLNVELESLHDLQKVRIAERHDLEADDLLKLYQDSHEALGSHYSNEKQTLEAQSEMELSDMEAKFSNEYQHRLARERLVDDEYVNQLFTYWTGKQHAEYHICKAREELRKEQDSQYKIWNAHRRGELQFLAEEGLRKMEILKEEYEEKARAVEERMNLGKIERNHKRRIENQWVEEVVRERIAMLQEMEQEEYGRV